MKERNRQFDKIVETKVSSGSIGNMRNYGSASQPLDRGCSEELKVKTATISENLISQTKDLGNYAQTTLNRLIEKVAPISRCELQTDCIDKEKRVETFPKLYEEWYLGNAHIEHILNEINAAIDRIEI